MKKKINRPIKLAVFDAKSYDIEHLEREDREKEFSMIFHPMHLSADNARLVQGCDAACIFVNDYVTRETALILQECGLGLIALRCAGYNNIDLHAVHGKMHVVRVPSYSPHAVAEHTVALMLTLNRKTHRAYFRTRDGNFALQGLLGFDMYGKTAGVIGTGKIGRIVAEILIGFGMHVLVYDTFPDTVWAAAKGASYVKGLHELYERSDVISLHCPLTADNIHMINARTIGLMKDGVMLVNTGRGKLINTAALIEALKTRKVGAAGLDVYEEEADYFFEDHSGNIMQDDLLARLLTFPNVLITSHQAFFTSEALSNIAATTLANIRAYMNGEPLENEICYRCNQKECSKQKTGRCF